MKRLITGIFASLVLLTLISPSPLFAKTKKTMLGCSTIQKNQMIMRFIWEPTINNFRKSGIYVLTYDEYYTDRRYATSKVIVKDTELVSHRLGDKLFIDIAVNHLSKIEYSLKYYSLGNENNKKDAIEITSVEQISIAPCLAHRPLRML